MADDHATHENDCKSFTQLYWDKNWNIFRKGIILQLQLRRIRKKSIPHFPEIGPFHILEDVYQLKPLEMIFEITKS